MAKSVVTTWFGAYLLEDGALRRSLRAPGDESALAERARLRREGRLTPEEEELLGSRGNERWTTRDRRLADRGLTYDPDAPASHADPEATAGPEAHRAALLLDAERAFAAAWDPSIHVEEAVRATAELDRIRNLLGERLSSWVGRDTLDLGMDDPGRAARAALEASDVSEPGPADPQLRTARRRLAELYRAVEATRAALESAVATSMPDRVPNLTHLLGADLAARLVAQAGGLERLARLPASTIQVLGAERAFFEHLRGRAPPPRHGLLFLHPAIQSAPRFERGKLARALAGKAAIAARRDRQGSPVDAALRAAFDARCRELKSRRGRPGGGARGRGSRPPFHRAAEHR